MLNPVQEGDVRRSRHGTPGNPSLVCPRARSRSGARGAAARVRLGEATPDGQALRQDLTDLSGTLLVDDATRYAAARDFGNIVHRMPSAVLVPGSVQDVVKTVRFANRHGVKVAMRTAGSHAFLGQSQVDGGIVIDARPLNAVRVVTYGGRPALEVGAGAQWGPVLDAANASRLTPPVNIDDMPLSVGGTLSTMGFGGATGREGFQVDHVLELEVVTGQGELVTCSDERSSDLFNAVLAGMGQCGIIVKATMELVPAPPTCCSSC